MTKPSILVVDDELLIRDLLYDFFSGQGWDIAVAENGERAIDQLNTRSIDVLLADIRMPAMDGLALTKYAREQFPHIPVILVTGFPSVESAVTALRSRVVDYVVKPFNINQLYKTVESALPPGKRA